MLILRKILLCDYLYKSILLLSLIIVVINIIIPKTSRYTTNSTNAIGIVTNIIDSNDKLIIYIANKETLIGTIYKPNKTNIHLGDTIEIQGIFMTPNKNTSKYLFNYQKYLKNKNINYIVKIKKYKKLKSNKRIYYYLKEKLKKSFHKNPYLYTFILGDKTYLNDKIKRSYQENGISHLFAISGMHISLLADMIKRISKKRQSEENRFKITTIILITYLFLVGFSPSILRGVLFYIVFSINNIYYFYISPKNLFIFILSISLIINPNYITNISFLYSYFISYALIVLGDYIRSKTYITTLLKTSVLSFVISIPISTYYFYQLNILSIIYNLFFVPLVSIIIFPMTIITLIIKPLLPIYNCLTRLLESLSLLVSRITIGKIIFKRLPIIIYIIYAIILLIWINKRKKIYIILFFFLLLIHYIYPYINTYNYIKAIDVGQGDSTLIYLNHKKILIDTGGLSSFESNNQGKLFFSIIQPVLKSEGISKLDYMIITHGDFDHMGEAINLVNNFKVEKVIFNCGEYNDLEKELIKVLNKKKIKYYSCIKELNIDKNKLYFLQTKEYDNENDNSNVIYTELNGYKFMFMGDASIHTEKEIIDKYNLPDIDVLKVGHHGSRTSSSKEFINEINPKYSIISVGKNNRYGHPNKEVLENLEKSKIYRTDLDGSIMFKIKNNKLKIETCSP